MYHIITIQEGPEILRTILREQKPKTADEYRLISFCIVHTVPDGKLILNTLTQELIFLSEEEFAHATENQELRKKWFVVPKEHDDHKLSQQVRNVARMLTPKPKGITGYTILTTTDCNARCFYCYEKGTKRINMSEETALQVAKYIEKNAMGQPVILCWFGGEPLYNVGVIDTICSYLREHHIVFKSKMVSNAYLFDKKLINTSVTDWKLEFVQITLDGTEEVYNKRKAYIYKDVNAFQRVIDNIQGLLDHRVQVAIRLNMDRKNIDNLMLLAEELGKIFGGNPYVYVYCRTLSGEIHRGNTEQKEGLVTQQLYLQEKLISEGLNRIRAWKPKKQSNYCMADNAGAVLITPTGELGVCDSHFQDELFGSIFSEGKDESVRKRWQELHPRLGYCLQCSYEPMCERPKLCPHEIGCIPETRRLLYQEIFSRIERAFFEYNHGCCQGDTLEEELLC